MALIEVAAAGPVARLTLNRPDQRNALSIPMLHELTAGLRELAARPAIRAVILRGAGPDFCAGADLAELVQARAAGDAVGFDRPFRETLEAIAAHPVPVVAEVQGRALGGGCQLVLACDLAVAGEDARIGIPSARLGVVIPLASIVRSVLAVGPKRANDLLLAGTILDAETAAAWGLVSRMAPPDELSETVAALAAAIADGAPLSVRATKRGVRLTLEHPSPPTPDGERARRDFDLMAARAFASEDLGEGIRAFRERREPLFEGR